MKGFGIFLILLGAGSFAIGSEFQPFSWLDYWGLDTGNMIRYGLIGGGVLVALSGLLLKKNAN